MRHYQLLPYPQPPPPGKYFAIAVSQLLECLEFTSCIIYIDF